MACKRTGFKVVCEVLGSRTGSCTKPTCLQLQLRLASIVQLRRRPFRPKLGRSVGRNIGLHNGGLIFAKKQCVVCGSSRSNVRVISGGNNCNSIRVAHEESRTSAAHTLFGPRPRRIGAEVVIYSLLCPTTLVLPVSGHLSELRENSTRAGLQADVSRSRHWDRSSPGRKCQLQPTHKAKSTAARLADVTSLRQPSPKRGQNPRPPHSTGRAPPPEIS